MVEERQGKDGLTRFGSRGRAEVHKNRDYGNPCLRSFSLLPHI